ncbi:DUF4208 domain containing protein [Musa troglodytarum]|uniref:DUF4208 domain containing protein n=1 Tax=Musa troglodytarum TaxID=320322 RepID=A0A9E7KR33_9LILI|nr:DUF4208 domain containing protein [Musa troglodytarum]
MAFFRNYTSKINSGHNLNEKVEEDRPAEDYNSLGNRNVDVNVNYNDADMTGDANQNEEEQFNTGRLQTDNSEGDASGKLGKRAAPTGAWGSKFWKVCQPMSDSGDAEYDHNDLGEDAGDNYSEDSNGQKDGRPSQRGHVEVPAEEMLSDDYYEQDGEEQSDSLHGSGPSHLNVSGSRLLTQPVSVTKSIAKGAKVTRHEEYNDDGDDDDDYDEDDEEEEDDPDDADFEPESSDTGKGRKSKEKASDSDDFDDNNEDDIDLSEEDDNDYFDNRRRRMPRKVGQSLKQKDTKPSVNIRRKRGRTFSDEEYHSSGNDLEEDSEEDFSRKARNSSQSRKRGGGNSTMTANTNLISSELRTSGRLVKKVSYAESEESEDVDEEKSNKFQKEDAEEDDGDSIEKVLWHQPKGMAEDAMRNNRSTQPVVFSSISDSEPVWDEVEFYVKWKGQSYLHCEWKSFADLQNLSGFKKVLNYIKRATEERRHKKALSREEVITYLVSLENISQFYNIEVHDVSKEMELDLLKQYSQVERIFADRISKIGGDDVVPEYLVKWQGLSYAEATWEKDTDIAFAQDAIDDYKAREAATTVQGKTVDFQRKNSKASLRRLDEQPEWLKGGKLRDYQLEGLNFLVNSWRNDTNVILADEMGLGKTVQSVSMLGFLQNAQQIQGPFLVVVPLSTLSNWAREFKKWLPEMNIVVYVGNRASREEFNTKNKLLITGTPLQNSVEELWSLLHFLDPEKFINKDDFVEKYKNLSSFNEIQLANLHKELRPHILRRIIKDVEKSLPPKIERILRVEMSPLQKQYYKWILERNFHNLNKGVRGNQVSLLNIVVELKKCCNHPFLFESADHGYGGDNVTSDINKVERIVMSSGKLVILDKLLVRLRATNHRVLIFSQMVRMLDILAEYLSLRGFQFQRLDGSTRADLRHQAMEHFNAPGSDDFCFLLSTRAGGLGINLATADTVIIFDSDWNPQNDLQAMSRAHRIGQQEVVNIYRFVTSRSVEEDILERAKKKMVLDHLVIQKLNAEGRLEKKETKKGSSMFDKRELSAILRFGAEELFKEEKDDEDNKRLETMDIDEILERAEKVANFCSAEDDATFWSRLIQPEAQDQVDAALAPRAARNIKSYAEHEQPEKSTKSKKSVVDSREKTQKRYSKAADALVHSLPIIEGAAAQVREWSFGGLPKKDASHFVRAVKRFGNPRQIDLIVAEVGGVVEAALPEAQIELFDLLIDGCREAVSGGNIDAKGTLLDFFGVSVKAHEFLNRVEELQLLAKRIGRYKDPVSQFRLVTQHKSPQWSKSCGWNSVDDARLLLGIYYHGYGNWEKIRLDPRLGLTKKIAPITLGERETFLPRAPNLDNRASALLQKEFASINGKSKVKGTRKVVNDGENVSKLSGSRLRDVNMKAGLSKLNSREKDRVQKLKVEPQVKEEGEISDSEQERYQKLKEEKWMEWCADVMEEEEQTLKRLQRLQTTSIDLPKEKVLLRIRRYLQLIGRKIDNIVQQHEVSYKQSRMTMRLWNYVSTFSNLTGERLHEIYSKLKEEQNDAGVGPSYINSYGTLNSNQFPNLNNDLQRRQRPYQHSSQPSEAFHRNQSTGKSEAWKRRKRSEMDNQLLIHSHCQPDMMSNGVRLNEQTNSAGILVLLHFAAAGYAKLAASEGGDTCDKRKEITKTYYMELMAICATYMG